MSFRNRFFASSAPNGAGGAANGTTDVRAGRFNTGSSSLNASSFSAKESRRSLTRDEFQRSIRQISSTSASFREPPISPSNSKQSLSHVIDDEAEKHLGFVFSRTKRQACDEILLLLRTSPDSAEFALSALCGLSALSDADLIRSTDIDCAVWKQLLSHDVNSVRCGAVSVGAQVANRIWAWFCVTEVFETIEDCESTEQDVRNHVVQLWRAIADKYADSDSSVSSTCFEALDQMASGKRTFLFDRVARHLLASTAQVVNKASLVRTTAATRFATKLLVFALEEVRPHRLSPAVSTSTQVLPTAVVASVQSFMQFYLVPTMDGTEALNGDVCITAAEQALLLTDKFDRLSAYEASKVKVTCVNAALLQLRALDANSLVLPDSTRHKRRQRCAKILLECSRGKTYLRPQQRIRVLGRCIAICATYPGLSDMLEECCDVILAIEEETHFGESAVETLLLKEQGILRPLWKGADKPRHRLAFFLMSAMQKRVWTRPRKHARGAKLSDLAVRLLELCGDCLGWSDSSYLNHAAGHAYTELLSTLLTVYSCATSPQLEKFIRMSIEWRLEVPFNQMVKARLLWLYSRALCSLACGSAPLAVLGQTLVVSATTLAMLTNNSSEINQSATPEEDERIFTSHLSTGNIGSEKMTTVSLFVVCVGILADLARHVSGLRNAVAESFGRMSTRTQDLSLYERRFLEDRTRDVERPRSMAVTNLLPTNVEAILKSHSPLKRRFSSSSSAQLRQPQLLGEYEDQLADCTKSKPYESYVCEKQLSGGNDPLYILGSVRLDSMDHHCGMKLICTLKLFNVSSGNIGSVLVRVACRGDVRMDTGQPFMHRFTRTIPPGGFAQWTFVLSRSSASDDIKGLLSTKRGIDVAVDYPEASYLLPTWYFPFGLFLSPRHMDVDKFRFQWGRKTGSSSKIELQVMLGTQGSRTGGAGDDLTRTLFFEATQESPFHLVGWSNRVAFLSASVIGFEDVYFLITCQLGEGNRVALDIRSNDKLLLTGFDAREAVIECIFPHLTNDQRVSKLRILWSGKAFWAGSRHVGTTKQREDALEELTAPDSLWAVNCEDLPGVAGGSGTLPQGRDLYVNALQRWTALKPATKDAKQ